MRKINFELNITLRCNLSCPNCNRHCNLKPKWAKDSDITIEQLELFLDELRFGNIKAKRIKVVGGEPLLHPHFVSIYWMLVEAAEEGLIQKIKIDTNGSIPHPPVGKHDLVKWSGRKPAKKAHLPTLWSPTDLGLPITYPCSMPHICGISLDNKGYLPCSHAIGIVRTFGWEHLYSDTFTKDWDMKQICEHCVFAGPKEWRDLLCKPLTQITADEKEPTASWKKALEK